MPTNFFRVVEVVMASLRNLTEAKGFPQIYLEHGSRAVSFSYSTNRRPKLCPHELES